MNEIHGLSLTTFLYMHVKHMSLVVHMHARTTCFKRLIVQYITFALGFSVLSWVKAHSLLPLRLLPFVGGRKERIDVTLQHYYRDLETLGTGSTVLPLTQS